MKIIKTNIPGVLIIEPRVFLDSRGYFFESFSQREFDEKVTPILGHSIHSCKTTIQCHHTAWSLNQKSIISHLWLTSYHIIPTFSLPSPSSSSLVSSSWYMRFEEQLRYQTMTRNINIFVNCCLFMALAVYPHKSACGPISLNSRLIPGTCFSLMNSYYNWQCVNNSRSPKQSACGHS